MLFNFSMSKLHKRNSKLGNLLLSSITETNHKADLRENVIKQDRSRQCQYIQSFDFFFNFGLFCHFNRK